MRKINKLVVLALSGVISVASAHESGPDKLSALQTENDKVNYSVGYQVGGDFKRQGVQINASAMLRGIMDALAEQPTLLNQEEMKTTLVNLKKKILEAEYQQRLDQTLQRRANGKAFLVRNAENQDVKVLPSGLQYKILKPGTGRTPGATDEVGVKYEGKLIDGTLFGSNMKDIKPANFRVDKVIAAWTEALQMMKEGAQWQLFVPPELGYGKKGPLADQTLLFTVELVSIAKQAS